MKKILSVLAAVLVAGGMMAADYTHSVGGVVGGMYGASYKGFIFGVDGLALQADLAVRLTEAATKDGSLGVYTFEANPNVVYQQPIKSWGFGSLDWYAGGGLSLGLMNSLSVTNNAMGKFGINALAGLEIDFSEQPLALGFDFRPGYGLGFNKDWNMSFFDWALAASLRYRF